MRWNIRRRLRRLLPRLIAGLTAIGLGCGVLASANAVTVYHDLRQGAFNITRDTMVISFMDLPVDAIQIVSGVHIWKGEFHGYKQSWNYDLNDGANSGTIRVKGGAHMGSNTYDVIVTSTPRNRNDIRHQMFLYDGASTAHPHTTIAWGSNTTRPTSTTRSYTRIDMKIVKPGTNQLVSFPTGITIFTDLDGWLPDNSLKPDALKSDEGVHLISGFKSATVSSDTHINVSDNGNEFVGTKDEDNYNGERNDNNPHHNLQHMVFLRFDKPTLSFDYFSKHVRWSGPAISTNPPLFPNTFPVHDQHTATRTIRMHGPVNKTVTQKATVTRDGTEEVGTWKTTWNPWTTGQWDDYAPEVPAGYHISSGPSHISRQTVAHDTGDTTVDIYYAASTQPVHDQHTAARTIVMHGPVNRTEKQTATVTFTGTKDLSTGSVSGHWTTGGWNAYTPEVPSGWKIKAGSPSRIDWHIVDHNTQDMRVDVWYEHAMTPVTEHKTVTRTIRMHGPVDRTVTQPVTLTFTGTRDEVTGQTTGTWTTGSWDQLTPDHRDGWTPDPTVVGGRTVTHDMSDITVDVYYSTTPRFMVRTPSCDNNGHITYTVWRDANVGARPVRYGSTPMIPGDPHSLPSTWRNGAWYDSQTGGQKLTGATKVTSASPAYYWRADPPSASYTVTTKSRVDGKTLETHRVSGSACAITVPNPVIPDGWKPEKDTNVPPSVTIPVDGNPPSDITVWVWRLGVTQLPQTGGWHTSMLIGIPVATVLLSILIGFAIRMRPHRGREH